MNEVGAAAAAVTASTSSTMLEVDNREFNIFKPKLEIESFNE
uniref:Uncharacterized protein n=1 Tax=Brugia malayi TaxID=6279 RepID=A8PAK5_BRUMA